MAGGQGVTIGDVAKEYQVYSHFARKRGADTGHGPVRETCAALDEDDAREWFEGHYEHEGTLTVTRVDTSQRTGGV